MSTKIWVPGPLLVALLAWSAWSLRGVSAQAPTAAAEGDRQLFRVEFGLKDTQGRDWSGQVRTRGCQLLALREWHFSGQDAMEDARSWRCATRLIPAPQPRAWEAHLPRWEAPYVSRPGLLLEVSGAGTVELETRAGRLEFATGAVAIGKPRLLLDGAAAISRVPSSIRLSDYGPEDDYPAATVARDGTAWIVWQSYRQGRDTVQARHATGGVWSAPVTVTAAGGDVYRPSVAEDGAGRIWVVWAAREGDNWDLFGRPYRNGTWLPVQRLTRSAEPDAFQQLVADDTGRLWLVWQSWRGGEANIWARTLSGDRWSREVRISPSPADDWEPSVSPAANGRLYVAWDSYDRGSYDVLLGRLRAGPDGAPVAEGGPWAVGTGPRFQAHASVAADRSGGAWVAWDESGPNWGKDTGFMWEKSHRQTGTRLDQSRRPVLVHWSEGALEAPAGPLDALWPADPYVWGELPRLSTDGTGRLWAVVRQRTLARPSLRGIGRGHAWELYAVTWDGDGWSAPLYLPDSVGRNDMRVALAPDGATGLLAAWASDERLWTNPAPVDHNIYTGHLAAPGGSVNPRRVAYRPETTTSTPTHPAEGADVTRIRAYRILSGGREYRIVRGDMHRHTEMSDDGGGDGSLLDAYRYALDAAGLDFLGVTDHQAGHDREYSWWRGQKAADLFHIPGRFVPLFAYERSLPYPNGHRNLIFAQRGVRTLPIGADERQARVNTGLLLFDHLRRFRGISMPHTSATGMGTDWRDNAPDVEPLVEIFQGDRTSYEYEAAPLAASKARPELQEGGYQPAGFVWNAWARGYRLGVQASSDHLSTHLSYACILTEDYTRQGLLEAMRRRHAYAATDNIVLDVRMRDDGREFLMGDSFTARSSPRLAVRIHGTAPIRQVDVIRDNRFVYTARPGTPRAQFDYTDAAPTQGTSYYYVRVLQQDGQAAWSSPIWVERK